jgi:hypothetical protein
MNEENQNTSQPPASQPKAITLNGRNPSLNQPLMRETSQKTEREKTEEEIMTGYRCAI